VVDKGTPSYRIEKPVQSRVESSSPPAGKFLDIYKRATLLKQNDDRCVKEIKAGKIVAPYYPYRGQEIIPAALCANLNDKDYLCTIYRGVHDMLAKGFPLRPLWAELMGRATGACKGKGGAMHLTHPETGVMVTTGVVGSSTLIANGLGLAAKMANNQRVSVATFGDGATNIGGVHEALNLASIWSLPVIFVCQNNLFGEHTWHEKVTAGESIARRAASYGIHAYSVDGNDAVAMNDVSAEAVTRARTGHGPSFIEAKTFRFRGHIFGDADKYIDPQMKQAAIAADPVAKLRRYLVDRKTATEAQLSAIDKDIGQQIDDAVEFGWNSPYPDLSEMTRDVFAPEVRQ
jgi:acetoin:2,6-dichlorophenolindophenol oxidoreductase subunit alpha